MKNFVISICFIIDCFTVRWMLFGNGDEMLAFWPMLAVAASAAFGLWNVKQQYDAGKAQAEMMDEQADVNAEAARAEAEEDARAENDEMRRTRDQQRRRRATIESMYAKSGVVLEGSAADILAKQREVDEYNVQVGHNQGNERRKRFLWQAENTYGQQKFQTGMFRNANRFKAVAGVVNTGTQSATNFKTWNS